jgi:hypothetical protein
MKNKYVKTFFYIALIILIISYTVNIILFNTPLSKYTIWDGYSTINYIIGVVIIIIKLCLSVWLFIQAKRKREIALLWAILALILDMVAVFAFYWRLIYVKQKIKRVV